MRLREVTLQAAKPPYTVVFVGVAVSVLRIAIPRECLDRGPLETILSLLSATLCVSLFFIDIRRPNAVANHGVIGLLAGLLMGLSFVPQSIASPSLQDAPVIDLRI